MKTIYLRKVLLIFCVATLVLFAGFPLYWGILTSLRSARSAFDYPPNFLPTELNMEGYDFLYSHTNFLTYLINSTKVGVLTTLCSITIALFGGYSLARFNYPGKKLTARLSLATYMTPTVLLVIPLYLVIVRIGLANTHLSLIISYTTFEVPFAMLILEAFFRSIPVDIEEAAMVDGASRLRAFISVVLPQALPGIVAASVLTFMISFNEYLFALIFVSDETLMTIPVGISLLAEANIINWPLIMAAGVSTCIPTLLFFLFVQKYLIKGWGLGAVKG